MASKKKPATARKAAKPVMAWAYVRSGGSPIPCTADFVRKRVIADWGDAVPKGSRLARVRIVEVRR